MSLNTCFICDEGFTEGNGVIVKRRGIITFLNSSFIRKDDKADVIKNLESVKVHEECRKGYSRIDRINPQDTLGQSTVRSPVKNKLRSTNLTFNFKESCFYCEKKIDDAFLINERKKPANKRSKVYNVRSLSSREKILERAVERGDDIGKTVWKRIISEPDLDLVSAEAIYHHDCYVNFF